MNDLKSKVEVVNYLTENESMNIDKAVELTEINFIGKYDTITSFINDCIIGYNPVIKESIDLAKLEKAINKKYKAYKINNQLYFFYK